MYRIGDFSKLSQIPVKTLRYYDEIGLLHPARLKRSGGYRYYRAEHFERVNRILALKDLGFSLPEIRSLLTEMATHGQIREMVQLKRDEMERHLHRENLRLLRAEAWLSMSERGGATAMHDIAIRTAGSCLVASVRDTIATHNECERLFEELDHGTGEYMGCRRLGAVWHACKDGEIDCEALRFSPGSVRGKGRVQIREMKACRVASLIYRGENGYMSAYAAIRLWLATAGTKIVGPKREIYLDTGGEDGEPVTEIQFPIKS